MFKYILLFLLSSFVYANESVLTLSLNESMSNQMINPTGLGNSPKTINKIVAFVNKRIITQNELDQEIKQTKFNFSLKSIKNYKESDLRSQVLDQLILQEIGLDIAQRSGIKVSDEEVRNAIINIEKTQNLSNNELRNKLSSEGISYEQFREQVKHQISIEKLKQREVDAKIYVNDDEINQVLNSEIYKKQIDYELSDIVIGIPEQATLDVITAKSNLANQVRQELKKGVNFEELAIKYSSAPNALNGGAMGYKSSAALPPQLLNQLANLKSGEISTVIKFPVGFFIFKLGNIKKHGELQIVHQYHVRHILIKVNELTSDDEAHQKITQIYNKLQSLNSGNESQEFVKLARQYSEDTSSINGGDLGWVSQGDTVPQFEQVMLKTKPNSVVSRPFRSPFGWHILEVIETRDSNQTDEKEKAQVRNELRESKAQMLYAEWLRNIREMAYIKINDD